MTFYSSLAEKYHDKIHKLGIDVFEKCMEQAFDNWSIEKLDKTEFKMNGHIRNNKRWQNFNLSSERYLIFKKKFGNIGPQSNLVSAKVLEELKNKYPEELIKLCNFEISEHPVMSIEEKLAANYSFTVETVQDAKICQQYCQSINKLFRYYCDDITLVHSFNNAQISSRSQLITCEDEKMMDIIIEMYKRAKYNFWDFPKVICKNKALIKKFTDHVLNTAKYKEFSDSISEKKKLSKKDIAKKYEITKIFNYWAIEGDDAYYKELTDCKVYPSYPITSSGLHYLAKTKFYINYKDLSIDEVFELIKLGYNRFCKYIREIYDKLN